MDEQVSVLIVDDEESICRTLALVFGKKGYHTETAPTGCRAIEKAKGKPFDLALLDIRLPDMEGTDLMGSLKAMHPDTEVMLITGYASLETAVQALNNRAYAYLTKPLNMDHVFATVEKAIEKQRLVREKKEAEAALRESEQRLSSFMASATETFYLWDSELNLIDVNDAGLKMLPGGVSREDMVGKNILDITPGLEKTDRYRRYLEVIETGEPFSVDEVVPHPEFGDVHLAVKAFKVGDGLGMVVSDITERKTAEEAIRKAHQELAARVQELAKANEEIQSFIYSVSHDLRMPLVAVQGFANLLKQEYGEKLKGEAEKYLSAILQSTGKMSDLIEDLLQLSRVGRMDTEPEEVALESLVEAITTELTVKTPQRKLNFRIKEPLPETYCNRKRLYQVFSNLLGNAVKFTSNLPEAKIEVGVKKEGDNREFYVRDNGPGIDPQYHEEIFKVFRKFHGAAYEGSGMGLAFARKIVESWGGKIRLESEPGKGATFYFTIPEAQESSTANSEWMTSNSSDVV